MHGYNLRKRVRSDKPEHTVVPVEPVKKRVKSKVLADGIKDEEPVTSNKDEKAVINNKDEAPSVQKEELKPETKKQSEKVSSCQMVFGTDSCGELGLGKIGVSKKVPVNVPIKENVKDIACGAMHTCTLTTNGEVYTYGCNDEGALGRITDGDETLEAKPTIVPLSNKVVKVTAGDSHSAVLTEEQEIFVWGNFRDEHGSVGLTPESDGKASYKPIQILPEKKFKDIASGSNHMLILDVGGVVYSFGVGAQGQLGRLDPKAMGDFKKSMSDSDKNLLLTPKEVVNLKLIDPKPFICDAVYAGNFSSFATNDNRKFNRLAAWGLNNYHQLGFKGQKGDLVHHIPKRSTFTCSTRIIGVACGQHHTLFLTRSGRVHAAGRNEYGMLGLGKQAGDDICPAKAVESLKHLKVTNISAGINTSFAVAEEGKLYSWGMGGPNLGHQTDNDLKTPTEVISLEGKKVESVSAGSSFTSVVVK